MDARWQSAVEEWQRQNAQRLSTDDIPMRVSNIMAFYCFAHHDSSYDDAKDFAYGMLDAVASGSLRQEFES